ncbi:MAG TPA: radical SAM protein [Bryobacteraceae bacterium]
MRPIVSLDFPLFVKWYITSRCNLRCSHCYLKDYSQQAEHTQIIPIIDYLGKNGVQGVVLIGGEPLTRSDLEAVAERLMHHGIGLKVATNAILATKTRARSLVSSGAKRFQVSVEGASAVDNDPIRGKGTFEQILIGAGNLQEAGGEVALAVTVTRHNYRRIPEIFHMIDQLGISKVKFNAFIPIGTGAALTSEHALTSSICREAGELIASGGTRFPGIAVEAGAFYQTIRIERRKDADQPTLGCGAGTSSLIINSDLTLSACDMLVETDRTSKPINSPNDIGAFWRENALFQKWRGIPDDKNPTEAAEFSQVHQHGCHVAYRAYGKNIFRYGCK